MGKTKRRILPSLPCQPVAATAITMEAMAMILPMQPPVEFAAAISTGLKPA